MMIAQGHQDLWLAFEATRTRLGPFGPIVVLLDGEMVGKYPRSLCCSFPQRRLIFFVGAEVVA